MSPFRLYPEAKHYWSLADYGAVLAVMRARTPWSVLEFGPGSSTLALVEGGAVQIDSCEDDEGWRQTYQERLAQRYPHVGIVPYTWADPLSVPAIDGKRYDLALIDGPADVGRRPAVIAYALARCTAVLVPLEESEGRSLRRAVVWLADRAGRSVEYSMTGPLAGSFALIT